ncbi:hypothetical protein AVEN_58823-1, partial [Araneus ventricosus]
MCYYLKYFHESNSAALAHEAGEKAQMPWELRNHRSVLNGILHVKFPE